ncbi:Cytochrome b5 reductase 4 [Liparis tanakae]|uniref:cytochrome-b5 reductase n=1 Tax=Liparis tanakae TaxID=230148 RepID=A0A4Z2GAH1_9TELE|nr:Cytochrome b5 reductase 4 [Liparis tanakae]
MSYDENHRDSEEDDSDSDSDSGQRGSSFATRFNRFLSGFLRDGSCLRSVADMLNIPTQSFPAPSSQQRVGSSGQSGRNKVALKPGHSLMDWIRFSKSGKDLTGLRGRLIEVTQEELQKHNTREDCWTCIRGMVYNVTPYMGYHPGGEEELMKAAGIDGTDVFDQVHRWVNYESMLKECLVGRMATTVIKAKIPSSPQTSLTPPTSMAAPTEKDSRPRYDWFQTDATVHLVVYAKRKIPSSGCTIVDLEAGVLRLEVLLGKMSYMIHLRLADDVEGNVNGETTSPFDEDMDNIGKICATVTFFFFFFLKPACLPTVHPAFLVGKIQVTMRKQAKGKWSRLGQPLEFHNTFLRKNDRALHYRDCVLVSKTEVTHDTHVFRLQLPRGTVMHVPVGKHVYLKALVQDTEVVRPYTPVDQALAAASHHVSQESDLYLMIKVYPDGVLTPHLNGLHVGGCVSVSGPEGPFSLRPLRDVTHLYLLAAGTGFTPMARLIQLALQDGDTIRWGLGAFISVFNSLVLQRESL